MATDSHVKVSILCCIIKNSYLIITLLANCFNLCQECYIFALKFNARYNDNKF